MLKIVAFSVITLVCAMILWPFAIAGVVAYFLSGMRENRWVLSGIALIAAVLLRLASGSWSVELASGPTGDLFTESMHGLLNWAFAAILVSAFATYPAKFIEGYRSRERHAA